MRHALPSVQIALTNDLPPSIFSLQIARRAQAIPGVMDTLDELKSLQALPFTLLILNSATTL
jgi:hypothetical protein